MFQRGLLVFVSSPFSLSLTSTFSLSLSTCSLSCTSTSPMSSPPRVKTTALTHNEEYCPVAICNHLTPGPAPKIDLKSVWKLRQHQQQQQQDTQRGSGKPLAKHSQANPTGTPNPRGIWKPSVYTFPLETGCSSSTTADITTYHRLVWMWPFPFRRHAMYYLEHQGSRWICFLQTEEQRVQTQISQETL